MKKVAESGITLIALIVTIIVLLLLAGISITFLTGENGILNKAVIARSENAKAEAKEQLRLKLSEYLANNEGKSDLTILDGINIDGYESELTEIGRIISMKKDGETYTYLIDDKYNIVSIDDVPISNGDGEITVLDFEPKVEIGELNKYIVSIPDGVINKNEIMGYIFKINDVVKKVEAEDSAELEINDLNPKLEINMIKSSGEMISTKSITLSLEKIEYTYSGEIKSLELEPATYNIEAWGGQGGGSRGGKGAYAISTITLTQKKTINIIVGGQGLLTSQAAGYCGGGRRRHLCILFSRR